MATPPFQVKALYDYSSTEEDDLNFSNGQIITVTDVEDDDWYFGEYVDASAVKQEGLFPKNFVNILEPATPPRPSRTSKSKKELEPLAMLNDPSADNAPKSLGVGEEDSEISSPLAASTSAIIRPGGQEVPEDETPKQPPTSTKPAPTPAVPPPTAATKPALPTATKPAPPHTTEKSASGSFRDRINAFNKPAAPPVAPVKPSALGSSSGSGFVKKAFVAPPPSKNAYVPPPRETPPQKEYTRDEDSDVLAQPADVQHDERPTQPQIVRSDDAEEDQPKPTSLKDRIALLQKQQMEQAARHAEAGQKKEKQKRQAKKHVEPEEHTAAQTGDPEDEGLERVNSGDTTGKRSLELTRDDPPPAARSNTRPQKSREATPVGSPVAAPSRDLISDPNDADQSGIGETEEGEEVSTGRDDSDEKPQRKPSFPLPKPSQPPIREADVGDEEDNAEEEDDGEEDEAVDPEVKRRMEIRERMAKMSGGMGMAGMFGPQGGLPSISSTKQASTSSERKASGNSTSGQPDSSASRAPPVPRMPMPGLQKVRSPEQSEIQPEVSKEAADVPTSIVQGQDPEEMPDIEDMQEEPIPPPRRSTERSAAAPVPQERPIDAPPGQGRAPPPPLPAERPVPRPPSEARPAPPTPSQPMSPSEGSESDDEMSLHTRSSLKLLSGNDSRPSSSGGPPPLPSVGPPSTLQSRPAAPLSRPSALGRSADTQSKEMSPTSPIALSAPGNRSSRVPPIPGSSPAMPSAPQIRAPPPPPPSNGPPLRVPTAESRVPPMPSDLPKGKDPESEEEVTEYEGDYDTDIASSASHKDALKSHARVSKLEDDSTTDDLTLHHSGQPSLGLSSTGAPRAVPPPPPNQPPKVSRQSSDMPRGAPPPPPPPPRKDPAYDQGDNEEYDPYNYSRAGQRPPPGSHNNAESSSTPRGDDPDPVLPLSPPQRTAPPMNQSQPQYAASPNISVPSGSAIGTRHSMDVQRTSSTIRRSTEGPRPSGEQGFIAGDVDLGYGSQWWTRPDTPPPVFQDRRDLVFETEETSTTRRGGKQAITKAVYILFMDYSQTVVTVHFETRDPANASLEQRHEAPPQNLRQDQLENAHARFGSRIAQGAAAKEGSVVGDGSPHALILDLLSSFPDALLPVGVRAYGALVYANLANASVRQFDEIRPGDIVTFRNAKFQGHRGAMHSKYSSEVGKPDHVGVLIDWDGTKKKVRVWEQGRESKKVKSESFKLGDMRSGEVKVWRVMARSWIGWEGQN